MPINFTHNGRRPATATNVYVPGAFRPNMAPGKTYDDVRLDWDRPGPCRHIIACAEPCADINAFAIPGSYTAGNAGCNIINGPGMFCHQFGLSYRSRFLLRSELRACCALNLRRSNTFFSPPGATVDFRNPQTFGKITAQQGGFSGRGARTMKTAIFPPAILTESPTRESVGTQGRRS